MPIETRSLHRIRQKDHIDPIRMFSASVNIHGGDSGWLAQWGLQNPKRGSDYRLPLARSITNY